MLVLTYIFSGIVTGIGQTGSDSSLWGNGAAIALVLAQQGAKIFGCDLSIEAAEYTRQRITAAGGEISVVAADVTNNESVAGAVAACLTKYCRIDILVK